MKLKVCLGLGLFWDERRRKILPSFPFQSAAEIPRYKVNELSAFPSFGDLSFWLLSCKTICFNFIYWCNWTRLKIEQPKELNLLLAVTAFTIGWSRLLSKRLGLFWKSTSKHSVIWLFRFRQDERNEAVRKSSIRRYFKVF